MKILTLIVSLALLSGLSTAQSLNCARVANYDMHVSLDTDNKLVEGQQLLTWKNTGNIAVRDLYFHLYLNAFKNTKSSFTQEALRPSSASSYLSELMDDGWGYCDVLSISVVNPTKNSKTDIMNSFEFVHPDDDNQDDETLFKITLPQPVVPNDSVLLDLSFVSKLPKQAPRTGYVNDFYFVAQWFPKIAVWRNNTWNAHQFHAHGEFFADYGNYNVSITVPQEFILGACGVLTDSTDNPDGTVTYRYQQDCIHDFAWTAYANYRVATRMFEQENLPNVRMRLLYQPEHKKDVDDFFKATENTLKYFGTWYVPYPYDHITIVDPAPGSRASGMEYPTLFTTGTDWIKASGRQSPEWLTVHECGHQFFYGLVGTNEMEHPWMDEGFVVYATARCMNVAYGPPRYWKGYLSRKNFDIPFTFGGVEIDPRQWPIDKHRERCHLDIMQKCSWQFVDWLAYRNNAYEKPALMLWTLEGYLGDALFSTIMETYSQRFTFQHPAPEDFIAVVNEFAPENMDWFFDQLLNTTGVLDYAVTQVSSNAVAADKGYTGRGESRIKLDEQEAEDLFVSQVHVQRTGSFIMPVQVRVTFEDGEVISEQWDGRDPYKIFYFEQKSRIEKAEVDPAHTIWLDTDYSNNGMYRQANSFAAARWGTKWMFWLQHLFEIVAVFS